MVEILASLNVRTQEMLKRNPPEKRAVPLVGNEGFGPLA